MWKAASTMFVGGTDGVNKLKGRKVRTRAQLSSVHLYDPSARKQQTILLKNGSIGWVANPLPFDAGIMKGLGILIAFSTGQPNPTETLETLTRSGKFQVVVVNEPTFKMQFEIEVP